MRGGKGDVEDVKEEDEARDFNSCCPPYIVILFTLASYQKRCLALIYNSSCFLCTAGHETNLMGIYLNCKYVKTLFRTQFQKCFQANPSFCLGHLSSG